MEPLTQAEAQAVLKAVQKHRLSALYSVALAIRQTWERKVAEKGEGWARVGAGVLCAGRLAAVCAEHHPDVQGLLVRAGLKPRRFHDLRHACCSLLAQGVPPGTVMEILGHSNIQTTMMIYREVPRTRSGKASPRWTS